MSPRYFKRRWDEGRGDAFYSWGAADYYFEVSDEGWPTRQIEDYEAGPTVRYGPGREEDEYGRLGQVRLEEFEDWASWSITEDEFERAWASAG